VSVALTTATIRQLFDPLFPLTAGQAAALLPLFCRFSAASSAA